MRHRWRSLTRPDGEAHIAHPDPDEAFGVWMLGLLWALACIGLGYLGGLWVVPGVLMAGLLALWGWRHMEWLWWFPVVLVIATLVEPLSPLPLRSRFGPLIYIDLLAMGVALVAVVRSVGLGLPLLPRTPVDRLVLAMLALLGLKLILSSQDPGTLVDFKRLMVSGIVFYAATTVASRPGGSRWIWTAFPLTSALIGAHALWSLTRPAGTMAQYVQIADQVWDSQLGVLNALAVALPVSAGLALDAGRRAARVAWLVATLLGAIALPIHVGYASAAHFTPPPDRVVPYEIARMLVAFVTLVTLARLAWLVRMGRAHEGPRWLVLAVTFGALALLELVMPSLSGPVIPLLTVAAGLVAGTLRADARAARSGRRGPGGPEGRMSQKKAVGPDDNLAEGGLPIP